MPTNAYYFPPKTKVNHNSTPPLLLRPTNPLCMVVCQPPRVGLGEIYFLMKYGGRVSTSLGCIRSLYSTTWQTTLPYRTPGHKKHKKHNNQHEQAPPYPPVALVLSLHGNIHHGPRSWRRQSLWVGSWRGAFSVLLPLPVPSIGALK
jgi:hypothetical protein